MTSTYTVRVRTAEGVLLTFKGVSYWFDQNNVLRLESEDGQSYINNNYWSMVSTEKEM